MAAPVTDKVDLKVVAPVTPNPAATSNVDPMIVAPEMLPVPSTLRVDLRVVAPVTPRPAPTSKVDPIIVAPEIFAVPVTANVEAAVKAPLKVLAPANVCVPVVTVPEEPVPAAGILNVCVEPAETILNSVPDVPVANDWLAVVKPLRLVTKPDAENVMAFGELEIAIPGPDWNVLYSRPVEALFIPSTVFARPVVPRPVPPYASPIVEPFHVPLVIVPVIATLLLNVAAPVTPSPPWISTVPWNPAPVPW